MPRAARGCKQLELTETLYKLNLKVFPVLGIHLANVKRSRLKFFKVEHAIRLHQQTIVE